MDGLLLQDLGDYEAGVGRWAQAHSLLGNGDVLTSGWKLAAQRGNLGRDESKWGFRRVPLTKNGDVDQVEDAAGEEDAMDPAWKLERVREAQRIVGELVWLVTWCRPDLMYALNRMAVWTTKQPGRLISLAPQVWRFLERGIDLPAWRWSLRRHRGVHGCELWRGVPGMRGAEMGRISHSLEELSTDHPNHLHSWSRAI